MPAVATPSPSAQATLVEMLFTPAPDRREATIAGSSAARDRKPLEDSAASEVQSEDVIAGELSLDRNSHAFERQQNLQTGREQFSNSRASFNEALRDAADARARLSQQAAKPQQHAAEQTKPEPHPGSNQSTQEAGKVDQKHDSNTANRSKSPTSESRAQTESARQQPAATQAKTTHTANSQVTINPKTAQAAISQPAQTASNSTRIAPASGPSAPASASGKTSPMQSAAMRATQPDAPKQTAPSGPAKSAKPMNDSAPFDRILRFVRMQSKQDHASATMRLDPPELGRIRVEMDVQNDTLRLRIDSDKELAHNMLRENADSLRHALEASGVKVAELEIRPTGDGGPLPEQDEEGPSADSRAEHESLGDSDQHSHSDDADSPRQGSFDSSPAQSADAVTHVLHWHETLIDVQA
jgi:flagellar hook-length control protein FliK